MTEKVGANTDMRNVRIETMDHAAEKTIDGHTQFMKMEFPRFSRSDLVGWLMRCEEFFSLDNTLDDDKIRMASIHLDEKAWSWHIAVKKMWDGVEPT